MGTIRILKISITDLAADAVVNAANEGLSPGGGVCGAIFKAAGFWELRKACKAIGFCGTGSAVITPGFKLKAKYIIHAVGPRWKGGNRGEPELLYGAYMNSLKLAAENGCSSIGFPLISAGIFGYPAEEAWQIAIKACKDFLDEGHEMDIVFAVLNVSMIQLGRHALEEMMAGDGEPAQGAAGLKGAAAEAGESVSGDGNLAGPAADGGPVYVAGGLKGPAAGAGKPGAVAQGAGKHAGPQVGEIIGFHLPTEPHGCFSNWHPSAFTYAGRSYNCAEQYMMLQKVAMGRRGDLVGKIMSSSDPAFMKACGGKERFPEFASIKDVWDRHSLHIVKRGVKAKFMQNPEMLEELLSTGSALLAECAGKDTVWGIGINLHDPGWKQVENWRGSNNLGRILMEVREELWREMRENGAVQYTDYRDAEPIPVWKLPVLKLKRFPQYYRAVHVYADQMPEQLKQDFFRCNPADVEEMLLGGSGTFPAAGFFEMKQEVYEIAMR